MSLRRRLEIALLGSVLIGANVVAPTAADPIDPIGPIEPAPTTIAVLSSSRPPMASPPLTFLSLRGLSMAAKPAKGQGSGHPVAGSQAESAKTC